jgi:hypothetical protein
MVHGIKKRVLVDPPKFKPETLKKFGEFVDKWLKENLTPLPSDVDTSFEHYIATRTTYPEWRKKELIDLREDVNAWEKRYTRCNSFMKDEQYPEYKAARAINSRVDPAKILLGPLMAQLEKVLYELPYFIKHTPVQDRPRLIREALYSAAALYFQTDFTSFESSFVRPVMEACEFKLYRYMTQHVPGGEEWVKRVEECGGGLNRCRFRHCDVLVEATRMSGDNWTSVGNGFTNLMLLLFVIHESGYDEKVIRCFIEGDDGLGRLPGKLKEEIFEELGFKVKLLYHDSLELAGFCGMYFDILSLTCVGDPVKTIIKTGWTTGQYAMAGHNKLKGLLRAKAYSLAYQYAGSPVIMAFTRYLLRMTRSFDASIMLKSRALSEYERELLKEALLCPAREIAERAIADSARQTCERVFGVPATLQLKWEEYFDNLHELRPLQVPDIDLFVHPDTIDYANRFVRRVDRKDGLLFRPAF